MESKMNTINIECRIHNKTSSMELTNNTVPSVLCPYCKKEVRFFAMKTNNADHIFIPTNKPMCMTENHEVYLTGRGYVKVKDLQAGDVIINETEGKTNRVKVSDIKIAK